MSFSKTYPVWLLLLLSWLLVTSAFDVDDTFDPEENVPVEHHFTPNCGSSDDYYQNYDDDDDGGGGGGGGREPVCPNDPNPPTIWILEDGTRFMDSLKDGEKSTMPKGLLDSRGIFHDTGACYRFVSLEDNLSVEKITDLIIGLIKENKIKTILLIVEYDQLETLPKSSSLKHQLQIIQYILGDKIFENLFLIVGHPFGQGDTTAKRDATDKFSKIFQWSLEDIDLLPMSNLLNLYGEILKDKQIKSAIEGPVVSIDIGNQPPILLSDTGTKIEQTMFSVISFFSASEVETWQLEWLLEGNLLWRLEGRAEGVFSAQKESPEEVIETQQEVTYITKNLYAAKVWILPKGQKIKTIEVDVSAKVSSISVSVSAWAEWGAWSGCNEDLERTRKRQTENGKGEQKEKENCDITGLTKPNFCSKFEYPSPRILLLGKTGVGKSTLGNTLLGVSKGECLERQCIKCKKGSCRSGYCLKKDSNGVCVQCKVGKCKRKKGACAEFECLKKKHYKLGKLMPETEKLPFEPGSGIDSKTLTTEEISGQFLGTGPCVTLIDTPGAADSKGRDYEHAINMANFLKKGMKSFDAILLMCSGFDRRFSSQTIALLKLYEQIFGKEMWHNVIVEFSFWKHTREAACERKKDMSLDELKQQEDINSKLREEFGVKHTVPVVFVDPIFPGFDPTEDVEKREADIFKNQTITLWKRVKDMKKYNCTENCQAPTNFYTGTPWLEPTMKDKVEDGQHNFVVPCKIWNGITSGDSSHKNSDKMEWFFKGERLFSQDYPKETNFSTEIMDRYGFEIVPPKPSHGSMFAISTLTIKRVDGKQHQGVFKCQNKKGYNSWKLSIPFWSEWEAWSQCSKSCRTYGSSEPAGTQNRTRICEGHVNEEYTCSSMSSQGGGEEVRECETVFCPVEPVVSDWSIWTSCSPSCGEGVRTRKRTCKEGKFNLIKKYDLCPTKNNEPYEEQKDRCSDGPCPRNCKFGKWSDWTRCQPECAKDSNVEGQKKRYRSVLEQAVGGGTCDATEDATSCQLPECPVHGKWGEWHEGKCISSKGCGKGRQEKWRFCEGRKGAGKLCRTTKGFESEREDKNMECSTKECAIDCVLGEWSTPYCKASCDSHKDVTSSRSVITKAQHGGKACGETKKTYTCHGGKCPIINKGGGCYSRNSLVTLFSGNTVKMSSLKIGDNVEISDENGVRSFSEFVGWMEKDEKQKVSFYKLTTESGNELVMTGSHGLFIEKEGIVSTTFAKHLEIGDRLILSNQSNDTKTERLVVISMTTETGWLDPLTRSGTIMVNNISTSCYASYPHWLANLALFPARQWPDIFLDDSETQEKDGTREYIHFIKRVGSLFSSSGFRTDDKYSDIGLIKYFEGSFLFPDLRTGDKNLQETGVTIVWLSMMAGFLGILLQQMYKK